MNYKTTIWLIFFCITHYGRGPRLGGSGDVTGLQEKVEKKNIEKVNVEKIIKKENIEKENAEKQNVEI